MANHLRFCPALKPSQDFSRGAKDVFSAVLSDNQVSALGVAAVGFAALDAAGTACGWALTPAPRMASNMLAAQKRLAIEGLPGNLFKLSLKRMDGEAVNGVGSRANTAQNQGL